MLKSSRYNLSVPLRSGDSLVFNALSQKLALVSADELSFIENPTAASPPHPLTNRLLGENFVVQHDTDELAQVNRSFDTKRRSRRTQTITLAPTLGCNLACTYCFQGHDKPNGRMDDSVIAAIVDHADRSLAEIDQLNVCWYGGEPLMNQDAIWTLSSRLAEACRAAGKPYSASIVTSGYLLTAPVAQRLVECGVRLAQVTIDGDETNHDRMRPLVSGRGTHKRIPENLKRTVFETELRHSIRINVDSSNIDNISGFLDELVALGFGNRRNFKIYFAPIEAITAECRDANALTMAKIEYANVEMKLIKKALGLGLTGIGNMPVHMSLCQAVRGDDIIVLPNGDLHKCWDTVQDSGKAVGTIFELNQQKRMNDQMWRSWNPQESSVCQSCKILPICGGGCAFKTVYADEGAGEAGTLPCPSLKFNLAERIFLAACQSGVVTEDQWCPDRSPTWVNSQSKTGARHTPETVAAFAARIRKVDLTVQD